MLVQGEKKRGEGGGAGGGGHEGGRGRGERLKEKEGEEKCIMVTERLKERKIKVQRKLDPTGKV